MELKSCISRTLWHRIAPLALAAAFLGMVTGCDSTSPMDQEVMLQGAVTTGAGYSDATGEPVEDAQVRAYRVTTDGQLVALNGMAVTNSEGRYTLSAATSSEPVIVRAEQNGMAYSALIEEGAATGGTVQVAPMTRESAAQADVFARSYGLDARFTAADAAVLVGAGTAASLEAGTTTADDVAAAAVAATKSEVAFARHAQGGAQTEAQVNDARTARLAAYADFRTQLAGASNQQARRQAVEAYHSAFAGAYAGMNHTQRAHVAASGAGASARFAGTTDTEGRFHTAHGARSMAALSAGLSVEEEFRASGASQARLATLAAAREAYMASMYAATSAEAASAAAATYRAAVRSELAAELGVSAGAIDAAFAATGTAATALDAAVTAAGTAEAVAEAYTAFFTSAYEAAEASLGTDAAFGARVVSTLSAR